MQYQDRTPPDGINTPGRHPLREFLRLSLMAILAVVALGFLLNSAGGTLAGLIPFKYELWLAERIDNSSVSIGEASPFEQNITNPELQDYLQLLADRVTEAMEIEDSMPITLHYSNDELVNAYATIGGHVYFFKGLLSLLPHENALTMLMAHEFSHVSRRHTAKGLGGGLAVAMGTSLFGLTGDNGLFSFGTALSSTSFSRKMETQADETALEAVNKMYGHVAGAGALFEAFMQQRDADANTKFDKFLSTHPLDEQRIQKIKDLAIERQWQLEGETTPLPDDYRNWMR